MVRLLCLIAAAAGSIALQSCAVENEDTFKTTGTVAQGTDVSSDLRGFFYIVGDDGREYYPTNLAGEYRSKGMRIRFEARELPDTHLIERWGNGPVIELLHIEKISS